MVVWHENDDPAVLTVPPNWFSNLVQTSPLRVTVSGIVLAGWVMRTSCSPELVYPSTFCLQHLFARDHADPAPMATPH